MSTNGIECLCSLIAWPTYAIKLLGLSSLMSKTHPLTLFECMSIITYCCRWGWAHLPPSITAKWAFVSLLGLLLLACWNQHATGEVTLAYRNGSRTQLWVHWTRPRGTQRSTNKQRSHRIQVPLCKTKSVCSPSVSSFMEGNAHREVAWIP